MCTVVFRIHMAFYTLTKGYTVPGNQDTQDKLYQFLMSNFNCSFFNAIPIEINCILVFLITMYFLTFLYQNIFLLQLHSIYYYVFRIGYPLYLGLSLSHNVRISRYFSQYIYCFSDPLSIVSILVVFISKNDNC